MSETEEPEVKDTITCDGCGKVIYTNELCACKKKKGTYEKNTSANRKS